MNLSERAILVSLRVSLPATARRDKQAAEEIEKAHNVRNVGVFNKALINTKFMRRIKHVEFRARQLLYSATLPWLDSDMRLLPVGAVTEFLATMGQLSMEFNAEAKSIEKGWDMILEEAKHRLGALYIAEQYPTLAALRERFKFAISVMPVPSHKHLPEKLYASLATPLDKSVSRAFANAHREAWERLYADVLHMAERLESSGRVHESVVENLAATCDVLPGLNFADDKDLLKVVALTEQHLLVPVEALRKQADMKVSTAAAARKIATAMGTKMKELFGG